MNNTVTGKLLRKDSLKIANDFFNVLKTAFDIRPIFMTNMLLEKKQDLTDLPPFLADKISDENRATTIVTFRQTDKEDIFECIQEKTDENTSDIIYRIVMNGRIFEFSIWDSEDYFGYCTMRPDYDPETYVFCNIIERRNDGRVKYEMDFAFDLEKKTFLELFAIEHRNKNGLLRECKEINAVENELRGTVIFTNFN